VVSRTVSLPIAITRRFYLGIALLVTFMAIVGFWPTYFGPLLAGTLETVPVIHFHATVYSGWLLIFITQVFFAATGRIRLHLKLGKIGIFYGFALVPVGVFTAFSRFAGRVEVGLFDEARLGLLAPLTDMIVFPIFFGAAVAYRRKPEIHKRLMVVATTTLLIAAIGRMTFLGTPVPLGTFLLVWFVPIFLAMGYDFWTRRLIHPVYLIGLAGLFVLRQRSLLVQTEWWRQVSDWLATLVV